MTGIEIATLVLVTFPVLNAILKECTYYCTIRNESAIEEDHSLVYLRYLREIHEKVERLQEKIDRPNDSVVPLDAIESAAMFRH